RLCVRIYPACATVRRRRRQIRAESVGGNSQPVRRRRPKSICRSKRIGAAQGIRGVAADPFTLPALGPVCPARSARTRLSMNADCRPQNQGACCECPRSHTCFVLVPECPSPVILLVTYSYLHRRPILRFPHQCRPASDLIPAEVSPELSSVMKRNN